MSVRPSRNLLSVDLLRAHVGRSADDVAGGGVSPLPMARAMPKSATTRVAGVEQDVGRLDVPVDHVGAVRVAQRVRHLARDLERVADRELALPGDAAASPIRP